MQPDRIEWADGQMDGWVKGWIGGWIIYNIIQLKIKAPEVEFKSIQLNLKAIVKPTD